MPMWCACCGQPACCRTKSRSPAAAISAYTEMDRSGSSCPTLFAWNGRDYKLVADVLGAGVLGHWVAPGERNRPRPTEYVKLDRGLLSENHGKLSFKLIEPMEEVVYLDQVQLLAVDHPGGVEVFPQRAFASNPPYPSFRVVASRNPRPRLRARPMSMGAMFSPIWSPIATSETSICCPSRALPSCIALKSIWASPMTAETLRLLSAWRNRVLYCHRYVCRRPSPAFRRSHPISRFSMRKGTGLE
jgi:hypothetical protein